MAIGSVAAAALTYWVGRRAGDMTLQRLVSPHLLVRLRTRLERAGIGSVAVAAVLPPPFPLTPFVLTCGALGFDQWRFFLVFGLMRLVRFSAVALLARHYGDGVLRFLQSEFLQRFLQSESLQRTALVLVCIGLTAAIGSGVTRWLRTREVPA